MSIAPADAVRPGTTVAAAIARAADRTAVGFDYLMAQARIESGFDPRAQARTSTARGLFQFTAGTWLDTLRRHGADHGHADAARLAAGDGAARRAALAMRDDPDLSALMAGAFARDNAAALERKLGRPAGPTDLYLAHFLGPAGAATFLQALAAMPDQPAAGLLPAAAGANRGIFFSRDGSPRSVAEIHARFAARIGETDLPTTAVMNRPPQLPAMRPTGNDLPLAGNGLPPALAQARLAYLLLAELA